MKYTFILYCCLAAIVYLTSCQKEIDWNIPPDPPPPIPINDSIYLKEYAELDTTLPSGSDTIYQQIYQYDAQKRVIQTIATFYGFGSPDVTSGNFFYNGTDTLPYKYVFRFNDASDTYVDTIFLSYDQGLVKIDSTIEYNQSNGQFSGIRTLVYTAQGGNTFLQSRIYLNRAAINPVYAWSGLITKTYQNGNITVQNDTSTSFIQFTGYGHHEVRYDNKINPFYKVELPYPVLNRFKVQRNNVLEERSWDVPGTILRHLSYNYIYRSDGRPVSVKVKDVQDPAFEIKGVFLYTNL